MWVKRRKSGNEPCSPRRNDLPTFQRLESFKGVFSFSQICCVILASIIAIWLFCLYYTKSGVEAATKEEEAPLAELTEADELKAIRDRTLMIVMKTSISQTEPDGIPSIRDTWGKDVGDIVYLDCVKQPFTTEDVHRVKSNVLTTTGEALWQALQTTANPDKYDFVMKVDDVTFVRPDALWRFLKSLGPTPGARWLGHRLKTGANLQFNSGGAGYILTGEAVKKLREADPSAGARFQQQGEDIAVALALKDLGIEPEDTRDENGADRFQVFEPLTLLGVGGIYKFADVAWYHQYHWYGKQTVGLDLISEETITFHYVKAPWMRTIYKYLYTEETLSSKEVLEPEKWEKVEAAFKKLGARRYNKIEKPGSDTIL